MEEVNANFKATFIAFGGATMIGLILIFAVRTDWAQGLGSVSILVGATGFLIDGFAERRARPYTAALEGLVQQQGIIHDAASK